MEARGAGARLRARSARRCSPRAGAACLRRYVRRAPLAAVPAQPRALAALLAGGCARCPRGCSQALAQRCRRPRTHLARVSRRARRARRWPGCSRPPRARRRGRASCPRASAGGWQTRARAAWPTSSPSTAWPCSRRCRRTRCAARACAHARPAAFLVFGRCLAVLEALQARAGAARAPLPPCPGRMRRFGRQRRLSRPAEAPPAPAPCFAGSARGLSAAARARGAVCVALQRAGGGEQVSGLPHYRAAPHGLWHGARGPAAHSVLRVSVRSAAAGLLACERSRRRARYAGPALAACEVVSRGMLNLGLLNEWPLLKE